MHNSWCCILFALHFCTIVVLWSSPILGRFSCEKENWCSCQGTTEAEKNCTNLHHHPRLWNASLSLCLCPSSPSFCFLSSPPSFLSTLSLVKTKFKQSARSPKIFYILHTLWPWPWTQHYKALQLMMIYHQTRLGCKQNQQLRRFSHAHIFNHGWLLFKWQMILFKWHPTVTMTLKITGF